MNFKAAAILVVLMTLVGAVPAAVAKEGPAENSPAGVHQKLFDQFSDAADLGTDEAFRRLVNQRQFGDGSVAPRLLRGLLLSWKRSRVHYVNVEYRCDGERVWLTWSSKMHVHEEMDEAKPMLLKKLDVLGLKPADGLSKPMQATFSMLAKRQRPPQVVGFAGTKNGITKEIVADVQGGLVGGDYESAIQVRFAISCALTGEPPTLNQLIAACPCFHQPAIPARDAGLLKIVADQPVYVTASRAGYGGEFPVAVRAELEQELKRLGFEAGQQHSAWLPWERYSDSTSVMITKSSNATRFSFDYKPPQREPRQVLMAGNLVFEHKGDAELLQKAYRIATRVSQPSWTHVRLGAWRNTDYMASWRKFGRKYPDFWSSAGFDGRPPARFGEVHGISLSASRDPERDRHARSFMLTAKWSPVGEGWAARFILDTARSPGILNGQITFARWGKQHHLPTATFPLNTQFSAFSMTKDFGGTHYIIGVQVEPIGGIAPLAASPESFRNAIVAQIDALLGAFEKGVRSGDAVRGGYLQQSRTQHGRNKTQFVAIPPPHPERPVQPPKPSDRKLTDKEKDQIIRETTERLNLQKKLVLEHFRAMHAALLKAFPLDEL